jgi:hypothetical protein
MAVAIWEMEREDEDTAQVTTGEEHEGQIRQTMAAAKTLGTGPTAD